jgi:uncharacterized membrane protein
MQTHYNTLAGGEVGRIAALSDGLFAIAATILVLDFHTPEPADIHSETDLLHALAASAPRLLPWLLSLLTLGIFWLGQQTQLNQLERADRDFTWASYLFLAAITVLPFSTRVLADFFEFRLAIALYWVNILLCGATIYLTWRLAVAGKLMASDMNPDTDRAIRRRIEIAQALYFGGFLLGLVHTVIGVGFILAVQLNYAIAPFRPWRSGTRGEARGG